MITKYRNGLSYYITLLSCSAFALASSITVITLINSKVHGAILILVNVVFSTFIVGSLFYCIYFSIALICNKSIVSNHSLARIEFNKTREIKRENIAYIVEMNIGRIRYYMVVPDSINKETVEFYTSIYTTDYDKARIIQKDKRVLLFYLDKKTKRIFDLYNYKPTLIIK